MAIKVLQNTDYTVSHSDAVKMRGENKTLTTYLNENFTFDEYPIDTSKGGLFNGYFILNDVWTENVRAVSMTIAREVFGDASKIKIVSAAMSRYAFLKNTGMPPNQSMLPYYCDGEGLNVLSNKTIVLDIPSDCKALYIDVSYDGVNRVPQVLDGIRCVVDETKSLSEDMKGVQNSLIAERNEISIANSADIISGRWIWGDDEWQTRTGPNVMLVPISYFNGAKRVEVVGVANTIMAFLTSNDHTIGNDAQYCDGTGLFTIGENTVVLDVPDDCEYVYFVASYSGTSRLPSRITGIYQLNESINEVKSFCGNFQKLEGENKNFTIKQNDKFHTTDGFSVMYQIEPCRKIIIDGAAHFIWLRSNTVTNNTFDLSMYFRGWCECDDEGAELYAAPDCNYIIVEGGASVYMGEEVKDFTNHAHDLKSNAAYMSNLCIRYLYHIFVSNQYGGCYVGALSDVGVDREFSHRVPAVFVCNLTDMLLSKNLDLGLIGTTKFALLNQCKRYMQALVDTYANWSGYWESSLTMAYLASSAYRLHDYIPTALYESIQGILVSESDILINKEPGTKWKDNFYFNLYWKNAQGVEQVSGDSKSEEMGWYASCLGMACLMCPNATNISTYKRKFIEWSIISYASPSDIGSSDSYNGYSLTNLQGSNITDDGLVVNHNIIHPDYMASRTSCLFICVRAFVHSSTPIPKALLFGMKKVLDGYVNFEFTSEKYLGKYTVNPPYGAIVKDGAYDVYFPMGNDWGTIRYNVEVEYLTVMYSLCQSPRYDCSRSAEILLERFLSLQDRNTTGTIIVSSSENSYGNGNLYACNCASAMITPLFCNWCLENGFRWTDDAWYSNE